MVEKEEVKNKKKKELALIKLFFSEIGAVFKIFCFEIEGWERVPDSDTWCKKKLLYFTQLLNNRIKL